MTGLVVARPGPLSTVQDLGRPGYSRLGVGRSGAVDRTSFLLANRLVGNRPEAAALEVTMGGLSLVAVQDVYVSVTGADAPVTVDGRRRGINTAFVVEAGRTVSLGVPSTGVRTYLAVRGGVDVDPVLGSRSTDTLAGLGPASLRPGTELPVGTLHDSFPPVDFAPVATTSDADLVVDFAWGPRDAWFTADARRLLCSTSWLVDAASNRVGVRLEGPSLERARRDELPELRTA
jgi:biotin-dependent carboxylase-like uncharacterized protein